MRSLKILVLALAASLLGVPAGAQPADFSKYVTRSGGWFATPFQPKSYANGSEPTLPAPRVGDLIYSTTDSTLRLWNGSAWTSIVSATGSVPFNQVTAGTNTAALVVGTGGSLTVSGSGTINATTLLGSTWAAPAAIGSGTPAAGTFTTLAAGTGTPFAVTTAGAITGRVSLLLDTATATDDRITISPHVGGAARFDGTLSTVDLTGAHAWNLPNVDGTIVTTGDTGTVSATMLASTAVTPGSYGDATHVATFTVDQQGRLTAAGTSAITTGITDTSSGSITITGSGTSTLTHDVNWNSRNGTRSTQLGVSAGGTNTPGADTAFGGDSAGLYNAAANCTYFGSGAGQGVNSSIGSAGTDNNAFGTHALYGIWDGTYNLALGSYSLSGAAGFRGTRNIATGWYSGSARSFSTVTTPVAITNGTDNILIGTDSNVTASGAIQRLAIGTGAIADADGTAVFGSRYFKLTDFYFGAGPKEITGNTVSTVTLHATGASGTDMVATALNLASGISTGAATPATITFQTGTAAGSSSTPQTLSTRLTIGSTSIDSTLPITAGTNAGAPAFSSRSSGTKFVVYPAVAASSLDYAMGVESSYLWFSTAGTTTGFKWYGTNFDNTVVTNFMQLDYHGLVLSPAATTYASASGLSPYVFKVSAVATQVSGSTHVTAAGGTVYIDQQSLNDVSAVTWDTYASVYVAGPPIAQGSLTLTNPYALWIGTGTSRFGGHLVQTQTTAPTTTITSTTLNDGGGTGASITVAAGSTDNAGQITITAGNGVPTAGICGQIVFNAAFGTAPHAVILQPLDTGGGARILYVSNIGTASFQISADVAFVVSSSHSYAYWVL